MTPQTTTPKKLLRRYEEGRITATGLILTVLSLTGKRRLSEILEALPAEIFGQLKDFVDDYRPGMRVFYGPHPKMRAVRFVREWFDGADRSVQTSRRRDLGKNGTS